MRVTETIHAYGHENIQSTNRTTFEITKETFLTKRGDCIIAVGSTKGAVDLSPEFKEAARHEHSRIIITIEASDQIEVINAWGNPRLSLTHLTDFVVRKSEYVCGRTLAIRADKAAKDLSRKLVEKLRNPDQKAKITMRVERAT
jgi:hypothetical protein